MNLIIRKGTLTAAGYVSTFVDGDTDDETFRVSLGSNLPKKVTAGTNPTATVTIRDKG